MAVAAQSVAAVGRAAGLDLAVLYDSLQTVEVSRRLSDAYDSAGGSRAKILIRRVWIGDPPTDEMTAQLAHYRSYAPDRAIANWGDHDQLICGPTAEAAAQRVAEVMRAARCDTLNIRVQVAGLDPSRVRDQIACYGSHMDLFREAVAP